MFKLAPRSIVSQLFHSNLFPFGLVLSSQILDPSQLACRNFIIKHLKELLGKYLIPFPSKLTSWHKVNYLNCSAFTIVNYDRRIISATITWSPLVAPALATGQLDKNTPMVFKISRITSFSLCGELRPEIYFWPPRKFHDSIFDRDFHALLDYLKSFVFNVMCTPRNSSAIRIRTSIEAASKQVGGTVRGKIFSEIQEINSMGQGDLRPPAQ